MLKVVYTGKVADVEISLRHNVSEAVAHLIDSLMPNSAETWPEDEDECRVAGERLFHWLERNVHGYGFDAKRQPVLRQTDENKPLIDRWVSDGTLAKVANFMIDCGGVAQVTAADSRDEE